MNQALVVYPFEELNSCAFINSMIAAAKHQQPPQFEVVTAMGPSEFVGLFFFADKRISTGPLGTKYTEIMNYSEFPFLKLVESSPEPLRALFRVLHLITLGPQKILAILPDWIYFRLPLSVRAIGRVKRFYLRSGYRNQFVKPIALDFSIVVEPPTLESPLNSRPYRTSELGDFFAEAFASMANGIKTRRAIVSIPQLHRSFSEDYGRLDHDQLKQLEHLWAIQADLDSRGPIALLRTRNKLVAQAHNADYLYLLPLLDALADLGFSVINTGAPCMPFEHHAVTNFTHRLPPSLVMAIAKEFPLIVTSAGGDIFSAWAQMPYGLVLFDEEFSVGSTTNRISLLEARGAAGIRDLDLHPLLKARSFEARKREIQKALEEHLLSR